MTKALLGLGMGMALVGSSWGDHIGWIDAKRGYGGTSCCSDRDCQPANVALLAQDERESTVMIGTDVVTVPTEIVHPSEDPQGQGWVCFRGKETTGQYNFGGYAIQTTIDAAGREHAVPPDHFTRSNVRCLFYQSLG